jgi:hypothetical protein
MFRIPSLTSKLSLMAFVLFASGSVAFSQVAVDPNAPIPPADVPGLNMPPLPQADVPGFDLTPDPHGGLPPPQPTGAGYGLPDLDGNLPASLAPYAPESLPPGEGDIDIAPLLTPELVLNATLTEKGPALKSGVVWRVYKENPDSEGALMLVAQASGGTSSFKLPPGVYFVYCGFGFARTIERLEVEAGLTEQALVLNAGGLTLQASASDEKPLPPEDVRFDIYSLETDERGERKLIFADVEPGFLLRLSANTYHVVSRYGTANAVTSADVEVKAGKLSEVTLYQKAAEITLKLVARAGAEAIADTKWSILTPGGDIVTEGVGAFPSFILAEGDYTVIAKHDDDVFQHTFAVGTGENDEVEVLAVASTDVGMR